MTKQHRKRQTDERRKMLTKTSEAWFNLSLILQRSNDLTLIHVQLKAPLYQILDLKQRISSH